MPGKEYLSKISMKDNSTVKTIYISDEEAKTELSNARGSYNNLDARLDDIESNTVPEHTSTQSGKALTVANDGSLVWTTITGNTTYDLVDGNENGKVGLKNNSTGDVDYASVYGLGSAAYKSDSYFATSSDLEGYLSLYGTGTDSQSNNMKGPIRFGYNNSGTITSAEGLEFYTRTNSNYVSSNRWSYGTTWDPLIDDGGKNYYGCAQIGYYNGGGTDVSGSTAADGSITILPYHLTSGQKPWDPDIGLTVKKDHVWIDGNELLSTAGRSLDKSNNTISLSDFAIDIYDGDWNTDAVKTGWYCGSPNTQNAPTTSQQVKWWMGHVIAHDGGSQGIYLVQDLWNFSVDSTVTDMTGVPHYQRIRRYSGGTQTWTPWTQVKITDTTYSAGTGLTLETGNVINHTDSVDAKDTLGMYKIKFNASGHITESSAVSASDIKSLVSYTGGRFIHVDSNNTINFAEGCINISNTTGITSWNDVDKLGWYRAIGLNDAPPSTSSTQWWMGHVIAHDGGSQGIYLVQDLWNFSIGGDSTYDVNKFPHYVRVRRLVNGVQTWTPWTKVVTSGIPLDGTGDDTKENNVKGRITFGYTETNGSTTTVTAGTGLNIYVKSNSANFNSFVKWSYGTTWGDEGSTTVYPALIGYHNGWTSSSSTAEDGFICIKPYPTTSAPWSGSVGLVVKKDHVYIDNVELSKVGHSHSNLNLDAAVGSATRPVYFKSDGKPYVCTYKLEKDVPSDAVFTYTAGRCIGINNETISFADLAENITGGDWNNATKTGWYRGSSVTNQPPTISGQVEWFMGYVIAHSADYIIQDLWNFSVDSNYPDMRKIPHYRRCKRMLGNVPTWSDWTAVVEDPIPRAGTGTDDENHNVTGQLTFGYNNNGTITSTSALRMYTKAQSNYVAVARFSYGTNTGSNNWGEDSSDNPEYPAQIGYYNNYGTASDASTRGRIVLLPYHTSSNPWGGTVGLSIEKGSVKIDNVELSKVGHSHAFSEITSKPTTISGYGITDAKIDNGTITLGSKTITPLTSHQSVTDYDVTLSWNTRTSIAKIGTTDIHIKLPAEPSSSYTAGRGIGISSGTISLANYVKIFTTTEYSNGWNDITETGWWASSTTTNSPSTTFTNWWMGHVVSYDGGSQGAYVVQDLWNFSVDSTVTDMTGVPHYQRIRRYNNGAQVWTNWTQVKITDTTYSAGTGLTLGTGNVINHTDAVTAQDTLGMYKIKFNGSGHIKGSDPVTASDISSLGIATTDEKLKQEVSSADSNFSIVVSARTNSNTTPVTTTAHTVSNVYVHASDGKVYAPSFHGSIYGAINSSGTTYNIGSDSKDISGSSNSWNNATANGWYKGSATANAPSSDWYFGRTIAHSTTYTLQEVWQFNASNSDTDPLVVPYYVRLQRNGRWGQWKQVKFFQGLNTEINNLPTASGTVYADDYFVSQYANGGSTNTDYYRRPVIKLWDLFKSYITIGTTSSSGNAVTSISIANESGTNNRKITFTKGTFVPTDGTGATGTWGINISGSATSATTATKATQDESGNNIKSSYAASISISDHTITLKNKNGTSLGTVTVPDNNTTSVVNAGSAGSKYYCAVYCSEANGSSYTLYNYKGVRIRPRSGITDLLIGTNKQGSTNGITGSLYIFRGTYTGSIQIVPPTNGPSSDYVIYWPSSGGTLATTSSKSYDSSASMTKRGISGIKGSSPVLITDDNDKDHIIQNMTIRETAATLKIVFKDEQDKKPLYSIAEIPYLKDSDYDSAATIHMKEYDSKSGTYQVISTMIVVSIEHNKEGTLTLTVSPVDETVQLPYIDSVYECD